jgi:hypothetical protein
MAIKFEKIQPGMKLYDRRKQTMGNTALRSLREWTVKIISVDPARRSAVVSWNGNRHQTYGEASLRKLYDWSMYGPDAEIKRGMFDSQVVSVKRKKKAKAG